MPTDITPSSKPQKPPTAKRSPSILVTDARNNHGRSAPFAGASGRRSAPTKSNPVKQAFSNNATSGRSLYDSQQNSQNMSYSGQKSRSSSVNGKFDRISIDKILSDISDIPSAQSRAPGLLQHRSHHHSLISGGNPNMNNRLSNYTNSPTNGKTSGYSVRPQNNQILADTTLVGRQGSSLHPFHLHQTATGSAKPRKSIPPRLTQNLPPRTTKLSEKLVLIPESEQEDSFRFDDEDIDNGPPIDYNLNTPDDIAAQNRKTQAERIPKERRANKFPRVTAYCVSDSIRIKAAAKFLRVNHKIRPRIYDEALYAPYYLPLLPGDDDNRVKSSPGSMLLMEQLMNRSEQLDHHYEYYSGLDSSFDNSNGESSEYDDNRRDDQANGLSNSEDNNNNDIHEEGNWETTDFDPSEPQDFTPPSHHDYMESHVSQLGDSNEHVYSTKEESSSSEQYNQNLSTGSTLQDDKCDTEITLTNDETDKNEPSETGNTENESTQLQNTSDNPSSESNHQKPVFKSINSSGDEYKPIISPSKALELPDTSKHAELFIFSYGVIVFWNFSEYQEKEILADLTFARVSDEATLIPKSLIVRPIVPQQDIETEELHFTYSPKTVKPRIYNDMITLRSGDHMTKLAMSHAIAQSTKLSRFEARMDGNMHDVRHVPKMLALTGNLGLNREEVLKISGKLFKLRVDVNLSSNILDTPDFFWEDEPSLNPLYTAVREYLEIEQRILVLNERCKVFLELTEILTDSIAEYNMSRITWIIIILIALSLAVSSIEIAVRFVILRDGFKQ